jgi:PAS domain-containing protein
MLSAFLVFLVYAIIGTFAFGKGVPQYFGSFGQSCLTLSFVMFSHKYYEIYQSTEKVHNSTWLYFVTFFILVDLFLLDLVLAMIVEAVHADERAFLLQVKRDLKAAHLTLQEQHEDAVAARELLETILDSIADPIYVKDSNCQLVLGNAAYHAMLGKYGGADVSVRLRREEEQVLSTGRVLESEMRIGDHVYSTKKSRFELHFNEGAETERYIVAVCRDVSILRSTQQKLETLKRRASSMNFADLRHLDGEDEDVETES